jgi:hypothetical protein
MRIAFFTAAMLGLTSSVQADFVLVDSQAEITLRPHGQPINTTMRMETSK